MLTTGPSSAGHRELPISSIRHAEPALRSLGAAVQWAKKDRTEKGLWI
jgi:hypothetical protein